jgi:hypothetical protein
MIVLYGKGGFQVLDPELAKEEQETLLYNASKLLRARGYPSAAGLLERILFDVYNATNDFNDEFCVLFANLPLPQYEEMRELSEDDEGKIAFRIIADVITEIGPYIRFVACDLTKETPNDKWQKIISKHMQDDAVFLNKTLPVAVCSVVNEVLTGSHATLNALFKSAGAPGDPPELSHASKWKTWLLRASEGPHTDAHKVLGKILEEFMEVEPPEDNTALRSWLGQEFPSARSLWHAKKQRVESILLKYGLRYLRGGRIVETGTGLASEALAQALEEHDFDTIEVEFRRALQTVTEDPGTAITAGCAILEALFKFYLEAKGIELPSKQTLKPLWGVVQKELGLDPKDQTDADIQRILSGMTSVVDGVGALRTHAGSAHGGGKLRYRVKPRHARLLINSAHTLALFLIETWREREVRSGV